MSVRPFSGVGLFKPTTVDHVVMTTEGSPAYSAWLESDATEQIPLGGEIVFGRSPSCTVVFPIDKVSRRHACIQQQGDSEFWLMDMGSTNGTRHNGNKISDPALLNDGDTITIGGIVFTFRLQAVAS